MILGLPDDSRNDETRLFVILLKPDFSQTLLIWVMYRAMLHKRSVFSSIRFIYDTILQRRQMFPKRLMLLEVLVASFFFTWEEWMIWSFEWSFFFIWNNHKEFLLIIPLLKMLLRNPQDVKRNCQPI